MKFEQIVPRLKLFLEQHYNNLMQWRKGRSPSKKPRADTQENYEIIKKMMELLINIEDRKRPGKCTRNDAKRSLKKILGTFE